MGEGAVALSIIGGLVYCFGVGQEISPEHSPSQDFTFEIDWVKPALIGREGNLEGRTNHNTLCDLERGNRLVGREIEREGPIITRYEIWRGK